MASSRLAGPSRRLTTKVKVRTVSWQMTASAWTRATARDSSPPSSGCTSRSTRSTSAAHCRLTNAATCAGSNSPHTMPPTSLSHITLAPLLSYTSIVLSTVSCLPSRTWSGRALFSCTLVLLAWDLT